MKNVVRFLATSSLLVLTACGVSGGYNCITPNVENKPPN